MISEAVVPSETMQRAPASPWHQPAMGAEVLQFLNPHPEAVIVDGTAGTGGHSLLVLPRVLPTGRVLAIDRDLEALQIAEDRLREFAPQVTFLHGNFRHLPRLLGEVGIDRVDGLLLDLGMSSLQVDHPERGFSFANDGPIDMRMNQDDAATAQALINGLSADELSELFTILGEERFARRIARRIVQERRSRPITSTTVLARVIAGAVPSGARYGRLHPATRVFQALRMAVNDELGALQELLSCLADLLKPGGRAVILTYHSLEDRLVKQAFQQGAREARWTVLTKKPLRPSEGEVAQNPRARSAKLRAVERM
jgi:16S rRNA (cytosine1402-N4)-methyltransferase